MKSPEPNSAPAFSYADFVDELRTLVARARSFGEEDKHWQAAEFRTWRHRVGALTTRISRTHLDSGSGVEHRLFRVNGVGGREAHVQAFNRDLADTLIELDSIIENYEKYGEPSRINRGGPTRTTPPAQEDPNPQQRLVTPEDTAPTKGAPSGWPSSEKLTLDWLYRHMPMSVWIGLSVWTGAVFMGGFAVGGWPPIRRLLTTANAAMTRAVVPPTPASAPMNARSTASDVN